MIRIKGPRHRKQIQRKCQDQVESLQRYALVSKYAHAMVVSSPLFCIKLGQQKQFPLLLLAYQINCEIIRYKLSFLRHPVQCTWYIVHTYIFLGYDILFLRYIPAGSDLELECQVDLGDHGPDDHYRYLRFSFLFTCIMHAYMSSAIPHVFYNYMCIVHVCQLQVILRFLFVYMYYAICMHVYILQFHLCSTIISVL